MRIVCSPRVHETRALWVLGVSHNKRFARAPANPETRYVIEDDGMTAGGACNERNGGDVTADFIAHATPGEI